MILLTYGKYASLQPKIRKTNVSSLEITCHPWVRLELVPQGKLAKAEVLIKCAHGNHFKYIPTG